jgi:hypothetical protein
MVYEFNGVNLPKPGIQIGIGDVLNYLNIFMLLSAKILERIF